MFNNLPPIFLGGGGPERRDWSAGAWIVTAVVLAGVALAVLWAISVVARA